MIDAHIELKTDEDILDSLDETLEFTGMTSVIGLQTTPGELANQACTDLAKKSDGLISGIVAWAPFTDAKKMRIQLNNDSRESMIVGYLADVRNGDAGVWVADEDVSYNMYILAEKYTPLDVTFRTDQLVQLIPFLDAHPDLPIVIDHCAGNALEANDVWTRTIREMGRRPHVYYRLSGLATGLGAGSAYELNAQAKPCFDVALESFGTKRLMYGSGWPSAAATYPAWLNAVDSLISELTEDEKSAIYSQNAQVFYGLS